MMLEGYRTAGQIIGDHYNPISDLLGNNSVKLENLFDEETLLAEFRSAKPNLNNLFDNQLQR